MCTIPISLPPYPYVPGRNARHPEDWFDTIKASVSSDVALSALGQTQAWQAGLVYFNAGYFWECHEVVEAVWLCTPDGSVEREMTQALIQLANARLKLRMQKYRAVARLCDMVEQHLVNCPKDHPILGLTVTDMRARVMATRGSLI